MSKVPIVVRVFLAVLVCLVASRVDGAKPQAVGSPNVIVIMADDLGYGDIGCFGNKRIKTPNVDRLAAEGLRFTDFHSSGAVCSPTRAGLMTGRYQQRAGVPGVIVANPKSPVHLHGLHTSEVTFAELFKAAGYVTAIFGKWHLGYYRAYNPTRHGFDVFRGYVSGNVDYVSHVDQAGRLDWWRNEKIEDEAGYTTHLITKHAVDFIEANHDKPFCLYIPYEPPHYPYQGPNDKPVRKVGGSRTARETKQSKTNVARAYKEMVEEMDKGVGQVIAALRKHDLEKKTLVLFFSDNGGTPRGSNGPLRGHKGQVWEGGHRVPCIARWPGRIKPGGETDQLAITLDIMPTILAVAGIDPPTDRKLDGVNLSPLLIEGKSLGKRTLFWGHGGQRAVRDGNLKLVVNAPGQKKPALFDLSSDLSEANDLSTQQPKQVERLLGLLKAWEKDVATGATPQPNEAPKD